MSSCRMIIRDEVVEKTDIGKCPPMRVAKPDSAVGRTGFPAPPVVAPSVQKKGREVQSADLCMSARDMAKLEWTNPVDLEESQPSGVEGTGVARYDFDGNEITSEPSAEYKSELYHHGLEAGKPGYTLEELFHLSQSGFQSQKALAIKAIGAIAAKAGTKGRKSRREFHRILIGEWKAHIRLSVACSDTSVNVKTNSWLALSQLMVSLDKECGCVAADLTSIPEFFRALNREDENSVKVFMFITSCIDTCDGDEAIEDLVDSVAEAADRFGLDSNEYVCGIRNGAEMLRSIMNAPDTPVAEVIATLCDRVACLADEPLSVDDVELFERMLKNMKPSIPFYAPGQNDEFAWTSRCNMVIQAMTEFIGEAVVSLFLARLCWVFTSSLVPVECRAAIWANSELLCNMSRLVGEDEGMQLLGNHNLLSFTCSDLGEPTRENAMLIRAIRSGCNKFIQDDAGDACSEMVEVAHNILSTLGKV